MGIWNLLGLDKKKLSDGMKGTAGSSAETETVSKIVHALEGMETERARYVAAFAYLLTRVARADQHLSEEESRTIERIVMEKGHLSEEQAVLILQMAKTQHLLFSGTENFLVGREFKNLSSREDHLALLDCLYSVCGTDRNISVVEDNEIRKISQELQLSHNDFISVRLRHQEHLSVWKK